MQHKNYRFLFILLSSLSIFTACQKVHDAPATPPGTQPPSTTVASADDKLKDSVLIETRNYYLWYNQIPANFNPRTFADPDAIMKGIRKYSIEPGFSAPVDRYSFALKHVEYNNLANGISGDFGIRAGFITNTDLRVTSVERASPAGLAGVRRGWQIIKVNGSSNVSTSNADLDFLNNAIFNSAVTSFTFKKLDGTTVDITLKTATYQTHPIVLDSVYTINGKTIGYLNFSSYLGDTTEIYREFNRVFNRFTSAGIGDVIIDLRYNGGGYVSVAEKLSDYLAPSSTDGTLMMIQKYNDKLSQYNRPTYFKKLGSLNLTRVFFIVSRSTASASELVINNLKPLMDVKLIGDTTYGKPVGFFPITVGEWDILPVSFKTVNKNGDGNYFNGFVPDAKVSDGIDKDFGDITENRLASAIKFITSGTFRYQAGTQYQESPQVLNGNALFDEHSFKGTISTQRGLK